MKNHDARTTSADEHMARLQAAHHAGAADAADHWLDFRNGEPGFGYATVEFGPSQVAAEIDLRRQGYEPVPIDDAVLFPSRAGLVRVHPPASPDRPGQYQAWRVPMAWLEQAARRKEKSRMKHSLRAPGKTHEEELRDAELRLQRLRSMS